ncbi:MAG TPA: SRPBCC domain-containing protein, partial [Patescibacteria group bacterium]|nr:SRPBCC domain-containing protein [Patescibacteria group bacterium]
MKTIRQEYQIKAPVEKVWEALTVPAVIEKWGGGPSKMVAEDLSEFELWGGDIHGRNTEVVANRKLVQDWYSGKWEKPSRATFDLSPKDGGTL